MILVQRTLSYQCSARVSRIRMILSTAKQAMGGFGFLYLLYLNAPASTRARAHKVLCDSEMEAVVGGRCNNIHNSNGRTRENPLQESIECDHFSRTSELIETYSIEQVAPLGGSFTRPSLPVSRPDRMELRGQTPDKCECLVRPICSWSELDLLRSV
jgi:hypothetical protein